jgi:hypothetical protein
MDVPLWRGVGRSAASVCENCGAILPPQCRALHATVQAQAASGLIDDDASFGVEALNISPTASTMRMLDQQLTDSAEVEAPRTTAFSEECHGGSGGEAGQIRAKHPRGNPAAEREAIGRLVLGLEIDARTRA